MPNAIDVAIESQVVTLVTFQWGEAPNRTRYALWTADVSAGGNDFLSVPTMEVDYGEQHGGTRDEPTKLLIPSKLSPVDKMVGQRYTPCYVLIEEMKIGDPSTRRETWYGRVRVVTGNPNGKSGIAKVEVSGRKAGLDVPLGVLVNNECTWTLGSRPCPVDLSSHFVDAEIVSIDGATLTCVDAAVTGKAARWWRNGTVKVDGYEIKIREWESGSSFSMIREVPADWVGATARFAPGCDKKHAKDGGDCGDATAKWNAQHRFGGMGRAMPNRHAQFEEGED